MEPTKPDRGNTASKVKGPIRCHKCQYLCPDAEHYLPARTVDQLLAPRADRAFHEPQHPAHGALHAGRLNGQRQGGDALEEVGTRGAGCAHQLGIRGMRRRDARARDPARPTWLETITCYAGLHAVLLHRVAHALYRAEAKGFEVPADMQQNVLSYLRDIENHYPATYGEQTRWTLSAYALNVRHLMGDNDAQKALDLLFGFDFTYRGNHNQVVAEADCIRCHDLKAPAPPYLISRSVHRPYAGRLCDECHGPAGP